VKFSDPSARAFGRRAESITPFARLRRVLLVFIPVAAYSAEAVASAAKARSYGVSAKENTSDSGTEFY
jgi:hypothetical protein